MYSATVAAGAIERSIHDPAVADRERRIFESQYGARIALFRLLAVPNSAEHMSREELAGARRAVAFSSDAERALMLLQSTLTARADNLSAVSRELGLTGVPAHSVIDLPSLQ